VPGGLFSKTTGRLRSLLNPEMQRYFPWAGLRHDVHKKLQAHNPDAIFAYHFDALSTVYDTNIAPVMAGVGDLWHLPAYFRWKIQPPSAKKYLIDGTYQLAYQIISKKLMTEMLKPCKRKGAFAAHYAEWFRRHCFTDTIYLRTPVHDSSGPDWKESRKKNKRSGKFKILMIGDLATTSTSTGIREFVFETLPILRNELGENGFEVHLVGGGAPSDGILPHLNHGYIKLRGKVTPPDHEFLSSDLLLVPTPITLGIRVRIVTAFSFGCPVVAHTANAAGIPELMHDHNALLAGSGQGLTNEVVRMLRDNQLKDRLEEGGRSTFEKYFSEKVAAGYIVKEMENMIAENTGVSNK
ncbi:MAG: glycosyltransferase, partial [Nitrospirota bacterium]